MLQSFPSALIPGLVAWLAGGGGAGGEDKDIHQQLNVEA